MKYSSITKSFFAVVLILSGHAGQAQSESDDPARPVLGQTGKIFTLKFVPSSKRLTVELAGHPAAAIGPERVTLLARQFPSGSSESQPLTLNPQQNGFEILDALDPGSRLEIEVHDRMTKKTETFKVEQKARP